LSKGDDLVEIVINGRQIRDYFAAFLAFMRDNPSFFARVIYAIWNHKAFASA
jgi:hypothetical protein